MARKRTAVGEHIWSAEQGLERAVNGLEASLADIFAGAPRDVTEENLQARARGTILMAISNKFGLMVVTTGNKSEMSVGYATLYGDMNGGFNPIKDLYKTEVFRLARLRNAWKPPGALGPDGLIIPENVIVRPPTAELRENQTDQDTLPPYDVLDRILERLVEREEPLATIIAAGFDHNAPAKVSPITTSEPSMTEGPRSDIFTSTTNDDFFDVGGDDDLPIFLR